MHSVGGLTYVGWKRDVRRMDEWTNKGPLSRAGPTYEKQTGERGHAN